MITARNFTRGGYRDVLTCPSFFTIVKQEQDVKLQHARGDCYEKNHSLLSHCDWGHAVFRGRESRRRVATSHPHLLRERRQRVSLWLQRLLDGQDYKRQEQGGRRRLLP